MIMMVNMNNDTWVVHQDVRGPDGGWGHADVLATNSNLNLLTPMNRKLLIATCNLKSFIMMRVTFTFSYSDSFHLKLSSVHSYNNVQFQIIFKSPWEWEMEFHFLPFLYQFLPLCVGFTIKVLNITFHYCGYCAQIYI